MFSQLFFLCIIASSFNLQAAEAPMIHVETNPTLNGIIPDAEPAVLSLFIKKDGQVIQKKTEFHIQLDAPKSHFLVSTDFPIVEGTHLIDAKLTGEKGQVNVTYLFPIRGEYQLTVKATVIETGETINYDTNFVIHENPSEVNHLILFLLGIGVVALISGYTLAHGTRKRAIQ